MKKHLGIYFIVGFALFSMLFGSGNLIFPPEIGITGGERWAESYIAYFLADAVLGICSVFAMLKVDGDVNRLTGTVGKTGSMIINVVCIVCIGPLLAIPRNAAVTFEMGIAPLLRINADNPIMRLIFSVCFFGIVFLMTVKPSRVIDILGKYLTPILVVAITVLIVRGIIAPAGHAGQAASDTLIKDGIYNGYQTLDMMAGIYFSIIIIQAIRGHGLNEQKDRNRAAAFAAIIAGAILCFVYGGMSYLGATTGSQWTDEFLKGDINQAGLVINITDSLLGSAGVIVLSVIVALACLTTAVGLTSAAASYFSSLVSSWNYTGMVVTVCLVSLVLCNFGLSAIISIAAPILMLFYPTVMFLTLSTLGRDVLKRRNYYLFGAGVCFVVSAITTVADTFGVAGLNWIHTMLPLDTFGFNWLVPTLIAGIIGHFIPGPELEDVL